MALRFGNLFDTRPELIETFDFQDIQTGTGVANFYGIAESLSGMIISYQLIENTLEVGDSASGRTNVNEVANTSFDFDTNTFNSTRIINGHITAIIPLWVAADGGGDEDDVYISGARIIKVDANNNETLLTELLGTQIITSGVTANEVQAFVNFLQWDKLSNTRIRRGEKIRLAFDVMWESGTSNAPAGIFHNPGGGSTTDLTISSSTTDRTQLSIGVPFKINI